jgi:peptidoglycan/xylan/chitin deacetylase (PgdA/CDA1 family)
MSVGPRALVARAAYRLRITGRRACGAMIVAYHGFVERRTVDWLERDQLPVSDFITHLDYFSRHREVVPLSSVIDDVAAGRTPNRRSIAIVFDDALASVERLAIPELVCRQFPFTIAVPAGLPDSGRSLWEYEAASLVYRMTRAGTLADLDRELTTRRADRAPDTQSRFKAWLRMCTDSDDRLGLLDELIGRFDPGLREWIHADGRFRIMSWSALREATRVGGTLASHGFDHHPHNATMTDASRTRELRDSREAIERKASCACDAFVWPEGAVTDRSIDIGFAAGYRCFLSSRAGVVRGDVSVRDVPRVSAQWTLPQLLWQTDRLQ